MLRKEKFASLIALFALVLLNIRFVNGQTVSSTSFSSSVTVSGVSSNGTTGPTIHSGTVVADFDGNGKIDLARVASSNAQVFRNVHTTGNLTAASFGTPIALTTSSTPYNIYSGDVNLDGKIDLIVTASGKIDVFFNTSTSGNISFAAKQSVTAPNTMTKLVLGDYTGDGKIDFAGVGQSGSTSISLKTNTTTGNTFTLGTTTTTVSIGTTVRDFLLVDIDLDNDLDIFGIYTGKAYCSLNSSGTFSAVTTSNFSAITVTPGGFDATNSVQALTSSDLNLDCKTDIIATQANKMFVFQNNHSLGGSFSFSNLTFSSYTFTASGYGLNVIAQDLNGDGKPEVLIPDSNSATQNSDLFTNNSSGSTISFETTASALGAFQIQTIRAADLNGDGMNDIIEHWYYTDKLTILQNILPAPPAVSISVNPSNSTQTICPGETVSAFTITAANATSYQWQQSFNGGAYSNIPCAITDSYTPNLTTAGSYTYRCIATNSVGSQTSNASGVLTLYDLPTLTTNPTTTLAQYCYNYNSTTAITVATSASSPTYQWQVSSDNTTFANVTSTNGNGGTTASFVPSHVDIWYGGTKYYKCIVTSNTCSTTSNSKPFGVYADLTWTNPSNVAQNICINSSSTALSMTATGPNVVYSWEKSPNGSSSWTTVSGANTNTYTPPTNVAGVNYYRCYITGTCSNTATASSGAITVTDTYTWTGATSTDPTVAGNWSPAALPCFGANEVIPSGLTNYPAYTNKTIDAGTTLTVQTGGRLTVTGTLTNNGTLTIENGATFIQGTSLAGSGTYNVKQTVTGAGGASPNGRFWYMGVPLNNLTRGAAFGSAGQDNRLWSWSESGQAWSSQIGNAATLTPTTGYVFRTGGPLTLNFSGTSLYSLNTNITGLTRTTGSFNGCHLMSNPYTAYLDWEQIIAATETTNLSSTYAVRTFNSASSEMVYDTYNATGDVSVNPSGVAMTQYIAPMQAFWISVTNPPGTLSMTKAMLSHQAGAVGLKDITSFPAFARLNLVSGNFYDQVVVYTDANATSEVEEYDSKKFFLPNKAQVYCPIGNDKLVINALKQGKAQTSAPLTVELPSTQVYKFEMAESFVENGLVILEDKQEGIFQDMGVNPIYEFFGNSGVIADRFVLHFQLPNGTNNEGQAGVEDLTSGQVAIIANHNGAITVALSADLTTSGDIQIFDGAGRLVAQKAITSAQTSLQLSNGTGVYFVRVQTPMKTEMKKVMVY